MQCLLLFICYLAALARSTPIVQSPKSCQQYTLPLNITSLNLKWALPPLETNEDVAALNTDLGRRDTNSVFHPVTLSHVPETAIYTISGTFCRPTSGGNGTVLLATHGGGYDRAYWDPSIQPANYSFVDYAVAQGYSIFYYDRLGLGQSEIVSGYLAQASIHAAIIKELVKTIRSDRFGSPASKVALVGHSLGSIFSNSVLNSDPGLVDAAVLTGIAYNTSNLGPVLQSKQIRLAKLQDPQRFGHLDSGWTNWVDIYANIEGFFKAPFYDREVVQWAQDHRQPEAILESISAPLTNFSSPGFTGPVMVMSGEYDFIFCAGYCTGVLQDNAAATFPASKNLVTYVQPKSGHAINLALNATGAFGVITNFLKQNDL